MVWEATELDKNGGKTGPRGSATTGTEPGRRFGKTSRCHLRLESALDLYHGLFAGPPPPKLQGIPIITAVS